LNEKEKIKLAGEFEKRGDHQSFDNILQSAGLFDRLFPNRKLGINSSPGFVGQSGSAIMNSLLSFIKLEVVDINHPQKMPGVFIPQEALNKIEQILIRYPTIRKNFPDLMGMINESAKEIEGHSADATKNSTELENVKRKITETLTQLKIIDSSAFESFERQLGTFNRIFGGYKQSLNDFLPDFLRTVQESQTETVSQRIESIYQKLKEFCNLSEGMMKFYLELYSYIKNGDAEIEKRVEIKFQQEQEKEQERREEIKIKNRKLQREDRIPLPRRLNKTQETKKREALFNQIKSSLHQQLETLKSYQKQMNELIKEISIELNRFPNKEIKPSLDYILREIINPTNQQAFDRDENIFIKKVEEIRDGIIQVRNFLPELNQMRQSELIKLRTQSTKLSRDLEQLIEKAQTLIPEISAKRERIDELTTAPQISNQGNLQIFSRGRNPIDVDMSTSPGISLPFSYFARLEETGELKPIGSGFRKELFNVYINNFSDPYFYGNKITLVQLAQKVVYQQEVQQNQEPQQEAEEPQTDLPEDLQISEDELTDS